MTVRIDTFWDFLRLLRLFEIFLLFEIFRLLGLFETFGEVLRLLRLFETFGGRFETFKEIKVTVMRLKVTWNKVLKSPTTRILEPVGPCEILSHGQKS